MNLLVKNIIGFFRASRIPNLVIIAGVEAMTAYFLLGKPLEALITLKFALLVISTLSIAAAGYIINDYYDQKIDMINRPEQVVVGVRFNRLSAILSHSTLNLLAMLIGFWIHPFVGVINFFSASMLWYYSNNLRRLPFLGNLIIAGLSGLTILIVAVFFRNTNELIVIYSFFAGIIVFIREVIKDIIDMKGDMAFGCTTIPVIWGARGAKYVIYLASLAGMGILTVYLMAMSSWDTKLYFLLISPFFLWFLFKVHKADTQEQFRFLRIFTNWLIFSGILSTVFIR